MGFGIVMSGRETCGALVARGGCGRGVAACVPYTPPGCLQQVSGRVVCGRVDCGVPADRRSVGRRRTGPATASDMTGDQKRFRLVTGSNRRPTGDHNHGMSAERRTRSGARSTAAR